nr:MAG TPA: hypothetical protein [Bacteriophage sp.]
MWVACLHDAHKLGCTLQRNLTAPQAMTLFFLIAIFSPPAVVRST